MYAVPHSAAHILKCNDSHDHSFILPTTALRVPFTAQAAVPPLIPRSLPCVSRRQHQGKSDVYFTLLDMCMQLSYVIVLTSLCITNVLGYKHNEHAMCVYMCVIDGRLCLQGEASTCQPTTAGTFRKVSHTPS